MEKQPQQKKGRNKTTAVLVWLLSILVLGLILAGGLYVREYLHDSFLAVAVEQPDLSRNEHVVRVTPTPPIQDRTAAPVTATPAPTALPSPTPTPVATEVPSPTPTLNPMNGDVIGTGMRSPIVLDIQIRLMTLEYLEFEQPEDLYGAGVANAVSVFQRRNGLPVTGFCDKDTFLKLKAEDAALYAVLPGDEGMEVESIQERLIELGYLTIPADGSGRRPPRPWPGSGPSTGWATALQWTPPSWRPSSGTSPWPTTCASGTSPIRSSSGSSGC